MNQKIRIKIKSFDHVLLDKSAESIVKTVKATKTVVSGPIPLPCEKEIHTVLRSPHVNKKSREHFQIKTHSCLIDLYEPTQETTTSLKDLDLPAGVDIAVKV